MVKSNFKNKKASNKNVARIARNVVFTDTKGVEIPGNKVVSVSFSKDSNGFVLTYRNDENVQMRTQVDRDTAVNASALLTL